MKNLYVDFRDDSVQTALTENGKLVEFFVNPKEDKSFVGYVFVGRIKTILPNLFAFIDIGGKKNAFLNLKEGHGLKAGDQVLVQVNKDATTSKGMSVSLEIKLKGYYTVVFESFLSSIGVSKKIDNYIKKKIIKRQVRKFLPSGFGAVIRTNAEKVSYDIISKEINELCEKLKDIKNRGMYAKKGTLLFPEKNEQSNFFLKDFISEDINDVFVIGSSEEFIKLRDEIIQLVPNLKNSIYFSEEEKPRLFEYHGIIKQLFASLKKEVSLPCGGYITIEETEACVVIDVNTGSSVDKFSHEEMAFETNVEATEKIAFEIRLRNLSGIILIDFIDMSLESNKIALLEKLSNELKKDRIVADVIGMVGLGMVQLTRRKTRPPISFHLEKKCQCCNGKGRVKI